MSAPRVARNLPTLWAPPSYECRCGSTAEQLICNQQVIGSNPIIGLWLRGQAVKTSPFHGGNTSSILVGVTKEAPWGFFECFLDL